MNQAESQRVQEIFEQAVPSPRTTAEDFVRRLVKTGTVPANYSGQILARKTRSIAASMVLVVKNADMLGAIAGVVGNGASSSGVMGTSVRFETAIRTTLLSTFRDAAIEAGIGWTPDDERCWTQVVAVIADASFGPARSLRAA